MIFPFSLLEICTYRVTIHDVAHDQLDIFNSHGSTSQIKAVVHVAKGIVRCRGQVVDAVGAKSVDATCDARSNEVLITREIASVGPEECASGV